MKSQIISLLTAVSVLIAMVPTNAQIMNVQTRRLRGGRKGHVVADLNHRSLATDSSVPLPMPLDTRALYRDLADITEPMAMSMPEDTSFRRSLADGGELSMPM